MAHKRAAGHGVFESAGKAVDESLAIAAAVREGRLTRAQFDSWYAKRSAEGATLIVNLRERTTRLLEPVETVIEKGREVLRSAAPLPLRRPRRRGK